MIYVLDYHYTIFLHVIVSSNHGFSSLSHTLIILLALLRSIVTDINLSHEASRLVFFQEQNHGVALGCALYFLPPILLYNV